jgi:hypothetical protein
MKQKRRIAGFLLCFMILTGMIHSLMAASSYTGTYRKQYKNSNMTIRDGMYPAHFVMIEKISRKKAIIGVEYSGPNGSPLYATGKVNGKVSGKRILFNWKDTWGNAGKGIIVLSKGSVSLKMEQTQTSRWNRGSLDTGGKYIKLGLYSRKVSIGIGED